MHLEPVLVCVATGSHSWRMGTFEQLQSPGNFPICHPVLYFSAGFFFNIHPSHTIPIRFFFGGGLPFFFFAISRAAPTAYGGSQARGLIGAVATGLRQNHSNTGSELHLQPTSQLTTTPDP